MSFRRQAIALEYGQHLTPVVTAKGDEEIALADDCPGAGRYGVYITQDPQLLALLSRLNVDDEIPPNCMRPSLSFCRGCIGSKGCDRATKKSAASGVGSATGAGDGGVVSDDEAGRMGQRPPGLRTPVDGLGQALLLCLRENSNT
jgi:type III secretion system FlhB-like substrate exporter